MKYYIRIKDGLPFEHPILESNFKRAFPDIDVNNLPPEFAEFERVKKPDLGVYEVYEGLTYEWVDGVVKDVHNIRQLTNEEKTEKQNQVKADWAETGFPSWIFNEETCNFDPPIPYPEDDSINVYDWNEETLSWEILKDIITIEENLPELPE